MPEQIWVTPPDVSHSVLCGPVCVLLNMWLGPAAANQTLKEVYILHEIPFFMSDSLQSAKDRPLVCILTGITSEWLVSRPVSPLNNTANQHNVKSAPASDVLSTLSALPRGLRLRP